MEKNWNNPKKIEGKETQTVKFLISLKVNISTVTTTVNLRNNMVHFDATVGNNFVECVITYHPRVNFLIILGSCFYTYNGSRLQ